MLAEKSDLFLQPSPAAAEHTGQSIWLDGVEAFHRATPGATVVAADLLVVIAAVALAGGSRVGAAAAAAAFMGAGGASGLYGRRSPLQTQGLVWYVRFLPIPLLAM